MLSLRSNLSPKDLKRFPVPWGLVPNMGLGLYSKSINGEMVQLPGNYNTVSAQLQPWGSIFQNGFLGEVLFEFNIPGVLIKRELY